MMLFRNGFNNYFHNQSMIGVAWKCVYWQLCRGHTIDCLSTLSEIWKQPIGHDTGISVYNSLTRCKTPLIISRDKLLYWYICGPTVYDDSHIGHASCYMKFDIIRRILEKFFNLNVVQLMGITDIDDKIIAKSQENKTEYSQLARKYEKDFFKDLRELDILMPTTFIRVSEFIPNIIEFIKKLVQEEYGYLASDGSVYFNLAKYGPSYGKLMPSIRRTTDETPVEVKKSAIDFALWKAAKPGEPWWDSPWGSGRPGWHIECSAMASHVFGNKVDIHSGGKDLVFPHHENELAQSTAYHHVDQWVNYWLHTVGHSMNTTGHVIIKAEKMSKSLKNVVTIQEFLSKHSSNELRLFCLKTHYRYDIDYDDDILNEAKATYQKFVTFMSNVKAYVRGQLQCQSIDEGELATRLHDCTGQVQQALADDFDTSRALECILALVSHINKHLQAKQTSTSSRSPAIVAAAGNYVERFLNDLGVLLKPSRVEQLNVDMETMLESILKFRKEIRSHALDSSGATFTIPDRNKALLKLCDEFRKQMEHAGVKIMDHGKDSSWIIQSEPTKH